MKKYLWLLVAVFFAQAAYAVYVPPTTDSYRLRIYTFALVTDSGQWIRFDTRPGGLWYGRTVDTDLFADMEALCADFTGAVRCTLVNHDLTLTPRRGAAPSGYFEPVPEEPATVTAPTVDALLSQ